MEPEKNGALDLILDTFYTYVAHTEAKPLKIQHKHTSRLWA